MDQHPDPDAPTGGYVNHPSYLEMRLRMLLTGTAGPNQEEWAEALKKLLAHLGSNPVPGTPENRTKAISGAYGSPAPLDKPKAVPARPASADAGIPHLATDISFLDLEDDYIPLVMNSDSAVVARLMDRVLDWSEPMRDTFVVLHSDEDGVSFAVDVKLHFEDVSDPACEVLTLFGSTRTDTIEWSHADISARHRQPSELAALLSTISEAIASLTTAEIKPKVSDELKAEIDRRDDALLTCDARLSDIVVTGDEGLLAFIAPGCLAIADTSGSVVPACLYHGNIDPDGSPRITAVTVNLR